MKLSEAQYQKIASALGEDYNLFTQEHKDAINFCSQENSKSIRMRLLGRTSHLSPFSNTMQDAQKNAQDLQKYGSLEIVGNFGTFSNQTSTDIDKLEKDYGKAVSDTLRITRPEDSLEAILSLSNWSKTANIVFILSSMTQGHDFYIANLEYKKEIDYLQNIKALLSNNNIKPNEPPILAYELAILTNNTQYKPVNHDEMGLVFKFDNDKSELDIDNIISNLGSLLNNSNLIENLLDRLSKKIHQTSLPKNAKVTPPQKTVKVTLPSNLSSPPAKKKPRVFN